MAYATVAELESYMGPLPVDVSHADAQRLLVWASDDVDTATMGAWYETDDNGNPTELYVINAFKKAVCAHVSYLIELGDYQGMGNRFNTVSIGDVHMSGGQKGAVSAAPKGVQLAPRAMSVLLVARLLPAFPHGNG